MYCNGFNSAFVEERPDSVPSHSSGSVSSLPRGHHTCRLLHEQLTHRDVSHSFGERRDHDVGKFGREGIRGGQRTGKKKWDQRWMEERKKVLGDRWRRGNEGSGECRRERHQMWRFHIRVEVSGWRRG